MSRYHDRGIAPILAAAASWVQRCIVDDGSIFSDERVWTSDHLAELDRYFTQNLDEGEGSFYEKLDRQLAPATPLARKLMSELLWVLYLFPSNLGPQSKRDGVARAWRLSGDALDAAHPMLTDGVLAGIGSGGMAFLSGRWREINYAISLFSALKRLSVSERSTIVGDYGQFADWLASQPREGNRQLRHMLRYLLFPDVVERMSSNGDRHKVLEAFGIATATESSTWTDRRIDEAMLALRQQLEDKHATKDVDFYLPPLLSHWRPEEGPVLPPPVVPPLEPNPVIPPTPPVSLPAKPHAPLNQILFGPPGTGKTYHTIDKALAILDPEFLRANAFNRRALKTRFDELAIAGHVQFVTFHQSFSYEDFVEGLRADTDDEKGTLRYDIVDGVFKRLCLAAQARVTRDADAPVDLINRRIWKLSLGDAVTEGHVYKECISGSYALLGYGAGADFTGCKTRDAIRRVLEREGQPNEITDYAVTAVNTFLLQAKVGDLVVISEGNLKFRAIGEITGDYQYMQRNDGDTYAQRRNVRWLQVYSTALPVDQLMDVRFSQATIYELREGSINLAKLRGLLQPSQAAKASNTARVLIIDEINRGNVSRIFGELITLIEPSKRAGAAESLEVTLPYSKQRFSVPDNVHIIGTMNTADRSLAGMDIALRRRFQFVEMAPRPELLNTVNIAGVNIGQLLAVMNQRIEALLDREHQLGHAYFMELTSSSAIDALANVFRYQVLPLLQEYFFEDWQRIAWVLNDHRKPAGCQFFVQQNTGRDALFGTGVLVESDSKLWRIDAGAFDIPASYIGILSPAGA